MRQLFCLFSLCLISFQTYGITSKELNEKFCSSDRVNKYKNIVKLQFEGFKKCINESSYQECKTKYNIIFSIGENDRDNCYGITEKEKKAKCYKLFDESKTVEAEELLFRENALAYFENADLFIQGEFDCDASYSALGSYKGKNFSGNVRTENNSAQYTGNLRVSMSRKEGSSKIDRNLFSLGTTTTFFHKDKRPGEWSNFEGTTPEDVEIVLINFGPLSW